MSSLLFKLRFTAPVHFGSGEDALSLYDSEEIFRADTLFSALCHTALSLGGETRLHELIEKARTGNLRLSDAMPWQGETFYLPKPCVIGESGKELPAQLRKTVKKMKWLPVADFPAFADSVKGGEPYQPVETVFGMSESLTRAFVRPGEDTLPYEVGAYRFFDSCGLWFLCLCPSGWEAEMEKLVTALSYSGIGGKISSGYGNFTIDDLIYLDEPFDEQTTWLSEALACRERGYLLMTSCLPAEEELDAAMEGAMYRLVRRGGFVQSDSYAEEPLKKQTQYFLAAGAVLRCPFEGALYPVGSGGKHPVWRYSRPILLGVPL